jgi:hypothetical protein
MLIASRLLAKTKTEADFETCLSGASQGRPPNVLAIVWVVP